MDVRLREDDKKVFFIKHETSSATEISPGSRNVLKSPAGSIILNHVRQGDGNGNPVYENDWERALEIQSDRICVSKRLRDRIFKYLFVCRSLIIWIFLSVSQLLHSVDADMRRRFGR